MTTTDLQLLDYRRQVNEMYAALRADRRVLKTRHTAYRKKREELFRTHPQSPLDADQQLAFKGLLYFPYDPALRFCVELDYHVTSNIFNVPLQADGQVRMRRFAHAHVEVDGQMQTLSLFWLEGYGGGVFLPFRDATGPGGETYGGGRYLLDTIKGADLGEEDGKLVLDFNYAYNPSCAYNSRWDCPLAPRENWLEVPIRAGEQVYPDSH